MAVREDLTSLGVDGAGAVSKTTQALRRLGERARDLLLEREVQNINKGNHHITTNNHAKDRRFAWAAGRGWKKEGEDPRRSPCVLDTAQLGSHSFSVGHNEGTVEPSTGNVKPRTKTVESSTGNPEIKTDTAEPRSSIAETKTGTMEPRTGTVGPRTGAVELSTGTLEPRTGTVERSTGTLEPRTGTVEPRTGTVELRSGTVEPRSLTVEPRSGTENEFEMISRCLAKEHLQLEHSYALLLRRVSLDTKIFQVYRYLLKNTK